MIKKILLVTTLVMALSVGTASATSIGLSFGLPFGDGLPGNTDVMLSARFDGMPFLLGLGFGFDPFQLGITADYILVRQNLVNFINFYAGLGGYLGVGDQFDIGLRIPLALYAMPLDPLEIFLELSPRIGIDPQTGDFPDVGVQTAFGFRFHF